MDRTWFLFLNGLPESVPVVGTIAILLSKFGPVGYAAILAWLWWTGPTAPDARRKRLLLAVGAAMLALAVNVGLNIVLPRPRPFMVLPAHVLVGSPPHDPSFPSDHAAFTSAIAVTLVLAGISGWGAVGLLGAFVIGTSRVIVGVHYPSDIVGGVIVGAICAVLALALERPLDPVLSRLVGIARRWHLA
jgi:undecaprenyl-diphosphatase